MKRITGSMMMLLAASGAAAQPGPYTLQVLDGLPGLPWHLPRDMEGSYIVGYAAPAHGSSAAVAVRWGPDGKPVALGGPRYAYGVNIHGDAVGGNYSGGSPTLWPAAGGIQSLPLLPLTFWGDATDINDHGDVVGILAGAGTFDVSAVIWRNGAAEQIPGVSFYSQGIAINNHGHVAGNRSSGSAIVGFYYDGATVRNIAVPGLSATTVEGMSDAGLVIGRAQGPWPADPSFSATHGFVFDAATGTSRRLGFIEGGYFTQPLDINSSGQIVGLSFVTLGPGERPRGAFIWEDGRIFDLQRLIVNLPPEVFILSANGINDRGEIAVEMFLDGQAQRERRAGILRLVCAPDFDGDGDLTIFDFLAFSNAFAAGDPAADFDQDGVLTMFDFLAFQAAFATGCD